MKRVVPAVALICGLAACQQQQSAERLTVLIGATAVPDQGARPVEDSVVVIAADKIRSFGERKNVPIPQNSDRIDFTGRWIVPAAGSRIEPGDNANLLVLSKAPDGIAPASPADVTARMTAGAWEKTTGAP